MLCAPVLTYDGIEQSVLRATILVVLGSVVIHGLLGPVLIGRYAKTVPAAATE